MPDAQAGYVELFELQDELQAVLSRHVDLIPYGGLNPLIREDVLAQRQVIYAA